jgi:Protein of unknown function (DUF2970)
MSLLQPAVTENMLQRNGSWLRTVQAVAWSFVGLRKGSEFQEDAQKLNPIHVIVVGLVGVVVFVVSLVFFVRWAVVAAS